MCVDERSSRVGRSPGGGANKLTIAARHSDLARLQAYRVAEALREKNPGIEIEFKFRASLGDLNQTDPLWKMPEKGVFTEDFVRDLAEGTADLVVHSWKDLPTEPRKGSRIAATLPRADVRDLLLFRRDRLALAKTAGKVRVLSSSPRRAHNLDGFLKSYLPFELGEVSFESVRGNIPTRLKKLLSQDADALIVAKAALDRLLEAPEPEFAETQAVIRETLAKTRFMVLPLLINPTAAAQGALAIEIKNGRPELDALLAGIHCAETATAVEAERRILASHGGGCHQKIGISVFRRPYGELKFLKGLTDAGVVLDETALKSEKRQPGTTLAAVFPQSGEEAAFFKRVALDHSAWSWAEKESFLWVARADAWPDGFSARVDAIVWSSGLKTWRKLARRGVWVSGSAESLGEDEAPGVDALVGAKPSWIKLSHQDSEAYASGLKLCATYRLEPKAEAPALKGRTHFFWMSASSFARALELEPSIRGANHACGPGNTVRHLRKVLGEKALLGIHLSVDDWRREILS